MRTTWTFHSAASLIFGRRAIEQLGDALRQLPAKRVFVVTDAALEKAGAVATVEEQLIAAGVERLLFKEGHAEPSLRLVDEATAAARDFRPDCVLGLGGGSNMDVAKFVAVLLAHAGSPRDYLGDGRIPGPTVPVICIPTTAGTGSEVSGAAAFTDTDNAVKVGSLSNYLRPRVAIVDPMLTVSCPPKVTADSGIDALTHAIEAFTAVDNAEFPLPTGERSVYQGKNPLGDLNAERGIELCGKYLRRAFTDGGDLEAREGMALAATLGGLAFSNVGVALVHALEYPVGGATDCSHGEGNGLLLPYVMRFNMPKRVAEFGRIAALLGQPVADLTPEHAAERAVLAVEQLRNEIKIPSRLRDLTTPPQESQLREFSEKAIMLPRMLRVNPRSVTVEDCEAIYRAAW